MNPNDAEEYVALALDQTMRDPPDSDFQRGYLAALCCVYREAFGITDSRLRAAEALLSDRTKDALPITD
jgi:hypothetical protein